MIELFSFPFPPERPSWTGSSGLRHLAFSVDDIDAAVAHLESHNVKCEAIRVIDTRKRFTFFNDPDGCRWNCMSSKACHRRICPVTCRALLL